MTPEAKVKKNKKEQEVKLAFQQMRLTGGEGESVRGAKRRVEEAGVLDIDVHGRYFLV